MSSNTPFPTAPMRRKKSVHGKAHQLFGEQLPMLLEELNTTLAA